MLPIIVPIVIDIGMIIVMILIWFFMMDVMRRMMMVMVVGLALRLFGVVRAVISTVGKAFSSDKSHCDHTRRHSNYFSHSVVPKLPDDPLFAQSICRR
jgi:hypothetical protein